MERVSDLPFCRRFEGFHRWPQRFLWAKYFGKLRPNRRSPAGLGLAIFLVFYVASGMGAGDVKLFGAVGAFAGPQAVVVVFVFTALLGGVAALVLALWRRRLGETLIRTGEMLIGRLRFKELRAAAASPESLRLPYGAVIAGGTLFSLIVLR